jgi:hypothetical protein
MQSVVVTSSTMPVLRRFAAFLVAVMLSVPCSAYALQQQDSAEQRNDQSQKRHYGDFCAMFTPCPKLEIPDSVFQMNYFEDFGMFVPLLVAVELICDSSGKISFVKTFPMIGNTRQRPSHGRTLMIESLKRFFSSLRGTAKLRADYVYCRPPHDCDSLPQGRIRHPKEGSHIFLIVEIDRPYGFIAPEWDFEPTGYYVHILAPKWQRR